MDTGLCTYQDLEKALNRAKNKKDKAEANSDSKTKPETNQLLILPNNLNRKSLRLPRK